MNKGKKICVPDPTGELHERVQNCVAMIAGKQPDFLSAQEKHSSQMNSGNSAIVRMAVRLLEERLKNY